MDNFKIDWNELSNKFSNKRIPLLGNEHKLIRVAFDLFRIKGNDPEELWQVQSSDDGEFLVRTYELPEEKKTGWNVESDSKCENITIAYKRVPLIKIAAKNISKDEIDSFKYYIISKLSKDNNFVNRLYNILPSEKRLILSSLNPEYSKKDHKLLELEKKLNELDPTYSWEDTKEHEFLSSWDKDPDILKNLDIETLSPDESKKLEHLLKKI